MKFEALKSQLIVEKFAIHWLNEIGALAPDALNVYPMMVGGQKDTVLKDLIIKIKNADIGTISMNFYVDFSVTNGFLVSKLPKGSLGENDSKNVEISEEGKKSLENWNKFLRTAKPLDKISEIERKRTKIEEKIKEIREQEKEEQLKKTKVYGIEIRVGKAKLSELENERKELEKLQAAYKQLKTGLKYQDKFFSGKWSGFGQSTSEARSEPDSVEDWIIQSIKTTKQMEANSGHPADDKDFTKGT